MLNKRCPEELSVTLYVNRYELATLQLSRTDWEDWAVGYLYSEGMIDSPHDLKRLIIDEHRLKVWADLKPGMDVEGLLKRRRHLTAGCGKGVTFHSQADVKKFKPVIGSRRATIHEVQEYMRQFAKKTPLYHQTGGVHAACLVDRQGSFVVVREDIGRHNAVDKVIGYALREGRSGSADSLILLTSGRISYEMLAKAARFGVGIVGSRTAATSQAVELAEELQVEVVGYIRGQMASVYTTVGRVLENEEKVGGGF
ncbi:formate dehydrogenase accessory sulfurtransferase FdhD [Ammoniphilus sp. CFH 90114]|uniref:formate dehydrogenase accessory sulfurtransferase FdhD n=1 Tax=Ammoniphilus sp. CFH 90114 TaxID=2493665 RepID=UPI00100F4E5B|nr:formate dehydrogenase accessory sulfurtransferase FdhD [Ammoniphilus sp. CFH 90114]RXT07889.1 formate dehydrogenase accessory sulfurtransferase FdhD [Ammoniphilus sp. CFH 90114]